MYEINCINGINKTSGTVYKGYRSFIDPNVGKNLHSV